MTRIFANLFDYPNVGRGTTRCYLQVYYQFGEPLVAIATELPDNHGTSVTNAIEVIADRVRQSFRIAHEDLVLIEYYPARVARSNRLEDQEIFSRVRFAIRGGQFRHPRWTHMPKAQVEALIQCAFKGII